MNNRKPPKDPNAGKTSNTFFLMIFFLLRLGDLSRKCS